MRPDKKNLKEKVIPTEPQQAVISQRYNLRELQEEVGAQLFYKILEPNNKNPRERFNIELQKAYNSYSQKDPQSLLKTIKKIREFSVSDLIKILPEVVNQKYVWKDCWLYNTDDVRKPGRPFVHSPLELAIHFGRFEDILTLVKNGAEINPKLEHGETPPLELAKKSEKTDSKIVLQYLNSHESKELIMVKNETPLVNETKVLKDGSYDPHEKAEFIIAKEFITPSAPPLTIDEELPAKISSDSEEKAGASTNGNVKNPIAAPKGFSKNFISYDVKIYGSLDSLNEDQKKEVYNRLLFRACKSKKQHNGEQIAILELNLPDGGFRRESYTISNLLSLDADPNYISPESRSASTPLINLVKNSESSLKNIMLLVKYGADINHINKDGVTALNAVPYGESSNDIKAYLLSAGANPNHRTDKTFETPLYSELHDLGDYSNSDKNHEKHLSYSIALIESGANINEKFYYSNAHVGWEVSTLKLLNSMNEQDAKTIIRTAIRNGQKIDPNSEELNGQNRKIVNLAINEYEEIKKITANWSQPVAIKPLTTGASPSAKLNNSNTTKTEKLQKSNHQPTTP